ncbi:MAG TPA: hypothetical protein DDZ96_10040 [Porphyromonadaceae bacterium]|nr:hypothetical protein [Porphyromonadaceae bacterium]HBL34138.1 hypothetical protein [Porphyromonadaceae bacterium]HBX19764.1 hypothetical protein [Porphyromonadaceae bacterium]HCM21701.1 hypothetical protein [Porphyromonadaceae bacterium]
MTYSRRQFIKTVGLGTVGSGSQHNMRVKKRLFIRQ